jgi:hypothetical protein
MSNSENKISKEIAVKVLCGFLIGLLTGILTVVGQKYLPGSLNSLANSGAVWLIPAFFVAVWAKRLVLSIVVCIETLLFCVVGYYAFEAVMNSHSFSFSNYYFYLWLGCAVVFGTVFGIGASFYSSKKGNWGASFLPAVFFAEGLNELIHLSEYVHMIPAVIGRIVIGIALYFIIYRKDSLKRRSFISFGVLSVLGVVGFELVYRLTT